MLNPFIKICAVNINSIDDNLYKYLLNLVSFEKQEKIKKYRFKEDKLRTLCGDVLLRYILINFYDIKNEQIAFYKNDYGKPFLKDLPFFFNISHSGEWVICAVSNENIGADIEIIKHTNLSIGERFFSKEENEYLNNTSKEEKEKAFFNIWTLKESYVKYIGQGLSMPLNSFSFKFERDLVKLHDSSNNIKNLNFRQYFIKDNYIVSVCSNLSCFPQQIDIINLSEMEG